MNNKGLAFLITLLLLRLVIGGAMFEAGLDKFLSGTFSATGYLSHGTGPFTSLFQNLTTDIAALNQLVMWGEMLVGVALILGVLVRFASFWGAVMMLLYYLPYLPPTNGWISQQIIYLIVFLLFMFSGAGYFQGLDSLVRQFEGKMHWLRYISG